MNGIIKILLVCVTILAIVAILNGGEVEVPNRTKPILVCW